MTRKRKSKTPDTASNGAPNKWETWSFVLTIDSVAHSYTISEDPDAVPGAGRAVLWRCAFQGDGPEVGAPEEVGEYPTWENAARDVVARVRAEEVVAIVRAAPVKERPQLLWTLRSTIRDKVRDKLPAKFRAELEAAQQPLFGEPVQRPEPVQQPAEPVQQPAEQPAPKRRTRNHKDPAKVARKTRG